MSKERDDLIILIDENGEEVEVEHIDTIALGDNEYVVLLPKDDTDFSDEECDFDCDDCDEEEEVVILKVEISEDGEETFVAIEDEDEQNAVFEVFTKRIEEAEYDEFDDEDDFDDDLDEDDSDDDDTDDLNDDL